MTTSRPVLPASASPPDSVTALLSPEEDGAAPVLSTRLRAAVDDVRVAADGLSAQAGPHEITADNPGALRSALARTLYEFWHTGRDPRDRTPPRTLRDPTAESVLARATPHAYTRVPALLREESDGAGGIAQFDGLRVRIPSTAVLADTPAAGTFPELSGDDPRQPVLLSLPAVRPGLSPGFFLADGSAGRPGPGSLLRVYLRLEESEAAPSLWHGVLSALERGNVRYRAKVLSNGASFPRNDALVVYLGPESWHSAGLVAEAAAGKVSPAGPAPVFAHPVAPGVSTAWEPDDTRPGWNAYSFGEHRSHVVAGALVEAALAGGGRPSGEALTDALTEANTDPVNPARNLDSADGPGLPACGERET